MNKKFTLLIIPDDDSGTKSYNFSKNLLVLPITNFYNYSSSISGINRYTNYQNLQVSTVREASF